MIVARRSQGAIGADPQCPYDALLLAWQCRTAEVHVKDHKTTAFFASVNGKIYNTAKVRDIARNIATLLGQPAHQYGGKSFRIGGASDILEAYQGDSEKILRQRGRWQTDIGKIYARGSVTANFATSRGMTFAPGADLERQTGWRQPRR